MYQYPLWWELFHFWSTRTPPPTPEMTGITTNQFFFVGVLWKMKSEGFTFRFLWLLWTKKKMSEDDKSNPTAPPFQKPVIYEGKGLIRDLYGDPMLVPTWMANNMAEGNQQKHLLPSFGTAQSVNLFLEALTNIKVILFLIHEPFR